MLRRIQRELRSFSFQAGMLFFVVLWAAILSLRLVSYYQWVNTTTQDIRAIVHAHMVEMDEAMKKYGLSYVKELVPAILEDSDDPHLYLALKLPPGGKTAVIGNIPTWPALPAMHREWLNIPLPTASGDQTRHLLGNIEHFNNGASFIAAYDTARLNALRQSLLKVLVSDVVFALIASLLVSIGLVWLVSRPIARINRVCEEVMLGHLDCRVSVRELDDEADDQFGRLAHHINRMLDWIGTLLRSVQDSSNAIAHDMRTPLSRHRLELVALSQTPSLPKDVKAGIHRAIARVDGLVEMFDHILRIAQAESRSSGETFELLDLCALTRDVAEFYASLMEERGLSLSIDVAEEVMPIKGDRQFLSQAIVNLLDNAAKYCPAGGHVEVALEKKANEAIITVADNGPGIPPEWRERAKERFTRLDESRHTEGSGLGLSLVNAVAAMHGGTLSLTDNGPGLRAELRLKRE
ncbi:HAMP domain-containing protein [bacterium]|nr:HAMP domain-containing protein [bacterium]